MHFCALCITHSITVMVLELVFYTKDPNGVGDALNIFISPYPPPPPHRVQRTPPHQEVGQSTGGKNLYLLHGYGFTPRPPKIHPIHQIGRLQQETGGVGSFCTVFPGNFKGNPTTHDIEELVDVTKGVSDLVLTQTNHQPTFPTALLRRIH